MKAKRFIAILLAALMCVPLLASCADDGPQDYTRPQGDTASNDSNFPSADYDGEDFTFLYIKHSDVGKDYYGGNYLDSEALEGRTVEDAVYERNLAVEEKYSVNINQDVQVNGDPAKLLQKKYMAGEFNFDVIYGWCYKLGACITENYFEDFYKLRDNGTADFDQEYWSPTAMEDLTIDGKLYLCMNDITMNKLEWAGFLFYNKSIYEDQRLEDEFGSIYDLVDSGKWTLDTYLNMVSYVSQDLDGNGTINKDDLYGLIEGDGSGSSVAHWCGVDYTTRNDDGSYTVDFYSEKLLDIINKVNPIYSNQKYVMTYENIWKDNADMSGSTDQWEYARSFFTTDHALFCTGSAYITSEFRNMESSYGIVPNPKYDENQKDYYAGVSCLASIFALPSTQRTDMKTAGLERTGTILEYLAYKSNQILLPVYYDTLLKGQRLDGDDDSRMLDIIRTSIRFEFVDSIGLEDFGTLLSSMFSKPSSATSTYERNKRKLQKSLDDFYSNMLILQTKQAGTESN